MIKPKPFPDWCIAAGLIRRECENSSFLHCLPHKKTLREQGCTSAKVLVSEKSGAIVKCICVGAFTAIAVSAKNHRPHLSWVTLFLRTRQP